MATAYLTRAIRFAAAHRYFRPEWTEARNREVFGACANPVGHGHNYVLEITVQGPIDPVTGFCIGLGELDALLRREILQPLDHQHINHAVTAFAEGGLIPSCENLAAWAWERLAPGMPDGSRLHRVRVREDEGLWADCYGGRVSGDRG